MNSVLDMIEGWVARGDRVAVATVVETKKSAPQPAGTKMGINELGEVCGAVSGGCVEGAVVEVAETVIEGAQPRLLHYGIADEDAWDVGLPCGGEITVWVQSYAARRRCRRRSPSWRRAAMRAALVTVVEGGQATGARMLVRRRAEPRARSAIPTSMRPRWHLRATRCGRERDGAARGRTSAKVFIDVAAPPPRLVIVGAVDFAAQLCRGREDRPAGGRS